jgi:hypothetical protein
MASTLKLTDLQHPSSGVSAITIGSDNSVSLVGGALSPQTGFKNRIINGAMTIDQRNDGSEVNPAVTTSYYLDRWFVISNQASKFKIGQNAGSVTPPVGFTNYLGCTSLSAYSVLAADRFYVAQQIEGFNIADLGWGTASASPVTLSFKVYSSLTGTFGGALNNADNTRSYPFSYTISSANTWTTVNITISGDTSGTWLTNNGKGITVVFSLGMGSDLSGTAGAWAAADYRSATGAVSVVGTSGATFYITGIQLEKGSVATPFEFRSIGQELGLCQRYYYKVVASSAGSDMATGWNASTLITRHYFDFPTIMRVSPSALEQTGVAADYSVRHGVSITTCSAVPAFHSSNTNAAFVQLTVASGLTAGQGSNVRASNINAYLAWSAEL